MVYWETKEFTIVQAHKFIERGCWLLSSSTFLRSSFHGHGLNFVVGRKEVVGKLADFICDPLLRVICFEALLQLFPSIFFMENISNQSWRIPVRFSSLPPPVTQVKIFKTFWDFRFCNEVFVNSFSSNISCSAHIPDVIGKQIWNQLLIASSLATFFFVLFTQAYQWLASTETVCSVIGSDQSRSERIIALLHFCVQQTYLSTILCSNYKRSGILSWQPEARSCGLWGRLPFRLFFLNNPT